MTVVPRPRPFTVVKVLYGADEAPYVRALLEAIAPDQQMAFVLLHADIPDGDAWAGFERATLGDSRLGAERPSESTLVEPNRIYLVPADRVEGWADGTLRLQDPGSAPAQRDWDRYYAAFSGDEGRRSALIVFHGARAEAAAQDRALEIVADAGGLALAQDAAGGPFRRIMSTAEQPHAVLTEVPLADLVNVVLEHAEPLLAEARPRTTTVLYEEVEALLPDLCEALRTAVGHDFRHYKSSTLVRRTLRRIHLHRGTSAAAYLERVRNDHTEAERLFGDLLVSVTAFFRDADAFKAVAQIVLPALLADRPATSPVRIWVAGCATGEEAYSLAMLVREYRDGVAAAPPVQIFATDLDEQALAVARRGLYPMTRLAHVTPERLTRFFTRVGSSYQVTKELREMVLFSVHNLTNDPPFSNLDLVSCRNLLIYLGEELHRRLIPLFHYALTPRGFLFLGPSESLTTHQDLFEAVDAKHRISRRLDGTKRTTPWPVGRSGPISVARATPAAMSSDAEIFRALQHLLTSEFTAKGVVVTAEGQIVATSGPLEQYLAMPTGPFVNNITRLVHDGLRVGLRAALREAVALRQKVVHDGSTLRMGDAVQRVMITVQPLSVGPEPHDLLVVAFQPAGRPIAPQSGATSQHAEATNALIEQLELDLATTRDELHRTVQDLEAVNEELKSSNEELLSMNEELQSANEELESSKEELQAANDALGAANNDLENLLVSTDIPTLFIDAQGRVRRITPAATTVYNIRIADVGRPLAHFTHLATTMPPLPDTAAVYAASRPLEDEVEMRDGRWFLRRVLPYRTPAGVAEGIVVTFTDVTARKTFEQAIQARERQIRNVIDGMFAFVGVLDTEGVLVEVNRAPLEVAGLHRDDVVGRHFWETSWWTHDPRVVARLREAFMRARAGEAVRYDERIRTHDGGLLTIDFMLQPVTEASEVRYIIPSAVDVTHRVEAEERLRYQRDLTQSVMDNATTAIFVLDVAGRCTFANAAAETMTGFTVAELVGETLHDRIHHRRPDGTPFDRADCPIHNARAAAHTLRDHADTFVRRDGTLFPVVCNAQVIPDGTAAAGTVLEVRDVSEAHRVAREMASREQRFHQLADSIPQLAWMAHADGHIFWYNQRWYEYTGTNAEAMAGWGWMSVHDPDVLPSVMERWRHSLASGVAFDMVFPLRGADGVFRPFLTRVVPFRDEAGAITMWFGTNTDVSEERARAEALRRQQRELQTFADNVPLVVARFDAQHRFRFANALAVALLGLPRGAFVGHTNQELGVSGEIHRQWEAALDAAFATGAEQTISYWIDTPDGARYYESRFVPELDATGQPTTVLTVGRDRTAERAAEQSLIDTNQRKDEFLATLAHELRNPLAPVLSSVELLRLTASDDPTTTRVLAVMDRQVSHLTRLVDDLLDVSRISLGKVDLVMEPVTLSDVVERAVELSRPFIAEGKHVLECQLPEFPIWIVGDRTRLTQVVGNLLNNAARYTPMGGRIALSGGISDGHAELTVRDNGVGIPEAMLDRVFDIFTQVDAPAKSGKGGLGIGLSLVRRLVDLHGGKVWARSGGIGEGSVFTIRLPLAPAMPQPALPISASVDATDTPLPLLVLIVDDNADAADSMAQLLTMFGYTTHVAYSGGDALTALADVAADIALVDIGLPDINGYEVAARIRADARRSTMTLIALTGWGSEQDRRRSTEAGFDFHLTKPADMAQLRRILASVRASS